MFRVIVKPSNVECLNHKQALLVLCREMEKAGLAQNADLFTQSACNGEYEARGDWMSESQLPADVLHQLSYLRTLCPRGYSVSLVSPIDEPELVVTEEDEPKHPNTVAGWIEWAQEGDAEAADDFVLENLFDVFMHQYSDLDDSELRDCLRDLFWEGHTLPNGFSSAKPADLAKVLMEQYASDDMLTVEDILEDIFYSK